MNVQVLVHVSKRWRRRFWADRGEWVLEPSLHDVTGNLASREGYWLMTFVGPDSMMEELEEVG